MAQRKLARKAATRRRTNRSHLRLVKPRRRTRRWPWKKFGPAKISPARDAWEEEVVLRAARDYEGGWSFTPRSLHEHYPGRFRSARAVGKIVTRLHGQGRVERFSSRHGAKSIYRLKPEEEGHERTKAN